MGRIFQREDGRAVRTAQQPCTSVLSELELGAFHVHGSQGLERIALNFQAYLEHLGNTFCSSRSPTFGVTPHTCMIFEF
jgi:hypothetical protein